MHRLIPGFGLLCYAALPAAGAPEQGVRVLASYPHDPQAYTQGLLHADGNLYESTGNYGHSRLRRLRLEDGRVMNEQPLSDDHFGEGLTLHDNRLFQLTWRAGTVFVYARADLKLLGSFHYRGEGWGLTSDGTALVMSDGSARLTWRDPDSFRELRSLEVKDGNAAVTGLNELEWVGNELYANVWPTDRIARIDPGSGQVLAWLDLAPLRSEPGMSARAEVANGIAYDAQGHRLFVTGKWWPLIFEIALAHQEPVGGAAQRLR